MHQRTEGKSIDFCTPARLSSTPENYEQAWELPSIFVTSTSFIPADMKAISGGGKRNHAGCKIFRIRVSLSLYKILKMKNLTVIYFLFFLLGVTACKKASVKDSVIAAKGSIMVIDQNDKINSDFSGISVSIENTNPVTYIPVSNTGEFEFPQLPGSFSLIFSKNGYGTVKQYYSKSLIDSIKLGKPGGQNIILLPLSSVTVNSFSGYISNGKFYFSCNVSTLNADLTNGVTLILQKNNPLISLTGFYGNTGTSRFLTIPVSNGVHFDSVCISRTATCDCDFINSGDNLNVKAFGNSISKYGNSYFNMKTNTLVFPSINENTNSGTLSFRIP